jgi:XTP/dITP diphosphohydrolase
MKWYFVSSNKYKYEELAFLCRGSNIELVHLIHNTRERQLADFEQIVSQKAIEAFKIVRSNVLVDHSGLEMECLKGLPAGLTQLFWDRLEGGLVDLALCFRNTRATAVTALGFCNGRKV